LNLFELFVKIGVDDQASGKLSKLSSGLGNGLATAAKIGTAAVATAAAGITALTTAAVNNYAEYEQLVGGVETLFKDSADTVMKYAENAYMTAGLSANEYMSTVTSFSASLLQSLGGDTAAAAEKADMAITDMADNANKMGTSMEMIQNAYQGFAKQNYTINLVSAA
jgi:gamma-glutamyl:cysteine ligase YbdK (ATP-grasp superfamily)